MKNVAVLGCGLVGSVMARDLAREPELRVNVFDFSDRNFPLFSSLPNVTTRRADLSQPSDIAAAIDNADAVVGAVPGRLGYQMLRTVIESKRPVCDISFSPEDPMTLDALAREKGVTAIVDCGVSPGLSGLGVGRAASMMSSVDEAVIYVGGLPAARFWPYEYRIVFSATDVIEEYTRPARMVENGRVVVKEALSEVELLDFPGIGTLEAFNTDGLRTLISTIPAKNMREKTLRYPGHADRMRMLRETGFFSEEPVDAGGKQVVPRELTERLLFRSWLRKPEEEELTVLRISVTGQKDGTTASYRYDLVDRTDPDSGSTSMARTTGFPCAIMTRLLLDGTYADPGVRPPEMFGPNQKVYSRLVEELAARKVRFVETVS